MPYTTGADIVADVLFRSGETAGATDWSTKVLDYINIVYQGIVNGSSEFLPEYIDDWWWMRGREAIIFHRAITTDSQGTTAGVTNNSVSVTLSTTVADSLVNQRIQIGTDNDVYIIATHTAGTAAITLDQAYLGTTNATASIKIYRNYNTLSSSVAAIMSPIVGFEGNAQVSGVTPERMDQLYPLSNIRLGVPKAFALEGPQTVRFNTGGLDPDKHSAPVRMEFTYRPMATDLADNSGSIPIVPVQYRQVIAHGALAYMFTDKDDDRAASAVSACKAQLAAMVKENRRRLAKMDARLGWILPRQNHTSWGRQIVSTYDGVEFYHGV